MSGVPHDFQIDLAAALAGWSVDVPSTLRVRDLQPDSRYVQPGDAFVALPGRTTHGLEHASAAVARGAAVVLFDPAHGQPSAVPSHQAVAVSGLADHLGVIADRAFDHPSQTLEVTGVTGTNGKTTSCWLYALARGIDTYYLGTIGAGRPPALEATSHTTLDVCAVHRMLRRFRDAGAAHVAMEVSSHALDQDRIAGVRMPITAFTNLSRDHLDYHGTMAAYGDAKERLFARRGVCSAVINTDDPVGVELIRRLPASVTPLAVGRNASRAGVAHFIELLTVECRMDGLRLRGTSHVGPFELQSPLVGQFNADNLLLVLGLLLSSGLEQAEALQRLSTTPAPPGRMESYVARDGRLIVVDYSHTPDALEKALVALRAHTTGRVHCVFGCGGDRDPGKRALMAQVAEQLSDAVTITDDNPRTEDPDRIVADIRQGLRGRIPVRVERDRAAAIEGAFNACAAGDVLLVAGKGHEDYQIYGRESRHFSDREFAASLAKVAA